LIDFRYHLVSIVAIFMALAVGIALGAGPLKDPVDAALGNQTEKLRKDKEQLRQELDALGTRVAYDDAWASQAGPVLTKGSLTGRTVLIVQLPGADAQTVGTMSDGLKAAGAAISGTLEVTANYLKPDQQGVLTSLVSQLAPAAAGNGSAYEQVAAALADAVVVKDSTQVGVGSDARAALLSGLSELGVIKASGNLDRRAGLALVIEAAAPTNANSAAAKQTKDALLPLVQALDTKGQGDVLGGPEGSAADGSLIAAVRADRNLRRDVSTVDVVSAPSGQVAAVLALNEQAQGKAGQYGYGPGADGPMPKAAA